jgi:hypothetical protein
MTRLRTSHVKSMSAFDKLPAACRQALRECIHNNITTKTLVMWAKALKAGAVTEAEIVKRIQTQDAERVRRRDEERREMEIGDRAARHADRMPSNKERCT